MRTTTCLRPLAAQLPWLLSCGLCLLAAVAPAQEQQPNASAKDKQSQQDATDEQSEEASKPPRPITFSDAADWQRVTGFSLSAEGKWCGFILMPNEGDVELVIREVNGDKKHSFTAGRSSTPPRFTDDGKWVAFVKRALKKDAKAAEKTKQPVPSEVVLIHLESGDQRTFKHGASFQFNDESSEWMAIRKQRSTNQPNGKESSSGTDLVLHHLGDNKQLNFGNVSAYAFNESGSHLAMIIDAQSKLGNGLQLFDTRTHEIKVLESESVHYKGLNWNKAGDSLVLLKEVDSDKHEEKLHHLIAYRHVTSSTPERVYLDMSKDAAVAEHLTISPNRTPSWAEDRNAILFGVHDARPKPEEKENGEKEKADSDAKDAGLVIWHWEDPRLQSQQQVQESGDKRFSFLCFHDTDTGKTIQIANEEMRQASLSKPYRYAIANDNSKYELAGNLDGQRYRDVYVIDLATGKRKLALEKARWAFGVSPTGDRMLYYSDGHFRIYDMATGESTNITENVPTSFVDTEDDHNVDRPPTNIEGWSRDGRFVFLSDNWDVWRVPVAGGEAINMTVNGKADSIRYNRLTNLDPEERSIELAEPVYLTAMNEWTKQAGFGRINDGQPGVEMLIYEDAMLGGLSKLEDSDHFSYSRMTSQDSPDMFVTGKDFKDPKQVTHSNPQQSHFLWSDGVKLIDYENTSGNRMQAALMLPANYIEGKSYPTIVYIYEKLSQRANMYDSPRVGGFSASIYTSNGYAVLMPDIEYRVNDPGISSVECVIPALDAAVASGVVDSEHVGLHGHSWGGYQTSFLITQTNRFKAAVAGAPLTNLISMYSSIYWNSGSANQPIFESSQGRFTGGYWTNIEAYARNSPVYYAEQVETPLLLLHNDKDGAVDWNQGIEYFNTLRRLKKPVVMLQYKGENHGVAKLENRKDYSYRMKEFFDHYLKGEEPPKWWAEGIEHLKMEEHIREFRKAKTTEDSEKSN